MTLMGQWLQRVAFIGLLLVSIADARADICPKLPGSGVTIADDRRWVLSDFGEGSPTTLGDVSFSYGHPREMMILKYAEVQLGGVARANRYIYNFGGNRVVWVTCNYQSGNAWVRISSAVGRVRRCTVEETRAASTSLVSSVKCQKSVK